MPQLGPGMALDAVGLNDSAQRARRFTDRPSKACEPSNEFYHITDLINQIKDRNGKVGVFPVSEKSWMDIGVWEEYDKTQQLFKERFSPKKNT